MTEAPTPGTTLACRDLVELVTDYLEDALDPATRVELEAHLRLCAGCAAYVEQLQQTIRELRQVRVDAREDRPAHRPPARR